MAYIVKVEIAVYQTGDDMEDVFRVSASARATDEKTVVKLAKEIEAEVWKKIKIGEQESREGKHRGRPKKAAE